MHRSILLKSLVLLLTLFGTAACDAAGSGSLQSFLTGATATSTVTLSPSPSPDLTHTRTPFQPLPTSTRTLIPSITPTFTSTFTATVTDTPTLVPTDTETPQPTLPLEHTITDIRGHPQFFPLGCETSAAKDWANYFGKDFNEFEFQYKLPLSDNPDYGFVGDVNGPWGQVPPYAYGVYAGPVADLLNAYGVPARAYKDYTLDQLKSKIAHDIPVIVWVIGNVVGGVRATYTDSQGRTAVVAAFEHVVIVTGYSQNRIRYMNEGMFYETPTEVFLNSWGILGNMVVVDS
jgi:uncharacterized protein YvpB